MERGGSVDARHSGFSPIGRPSMPIAGFNMGTFAAAARAMLSTVTANEESDETSAAQLKKEIERMQDRCLRLGALVAQIGASQQRKQKRRGQGEEGQEQLHAELHGVEQGQNVAFAAGEVRSRSRGR